MMPTRSNTYSTDNFQYSMFRFKDLINFFGLFLCKREPDESTVNKLLGQRFLVLSHSELGEAHRKAVCRKN